METVRSALAWVFTYILYPAVVVGIFLYVGLMLIVIAGAAKTKFGAARRVTGAILPLVSVVFLIATTPDTAKEIESLCNEFTWYVRLAAGAVLGILFMELSNLFRTHDDIVGAIFAVLVSSIGAFLMWAFIGGILGSLNYLLFGFVLACGFHFIFRGSEKLWSE